LVACAGHEIRSLVWAFHSVGYDDPELLAWLVAAVQSTHLEVPGAHVILSAASLGELLAPGLTSLLDIACEKLLSSCPSQVTWVKPDVAVRLLYVLITQGAGVPCAAAAMAELRKLLGLVQFDRPGEASPAQHLEVLRQHVYEKRQQGHASIPMYLMTASFGKFGRKGADRVHGLAAGLRSLGLLVGGPPVMQQHRYGLVDDLSCVWIGLTSQGIGIP
jgi:hypothetical protein